MSKKGVFILLFVALMFLQFASAKISISPVNEKYNLGDRIYITVDVIPDLITGSFDINLACENNTLNVYKISPAEGHFVSGEAQKIIHTIILTPEFIGEMKGTCNIAVILGSESAATKSFSISDKINIDASLDKLSYDPGETVTLNLNVMKENGYPLNGFLEASGVADFSKAIENGVLTESFATAKTKEAGIYTLNLKVYDKGGGDNKILNNGETSVSFSINQVPTSLVTILDTLTALPGGEFKFGIDIYDQSGITMNGSASITIVSPNNEETKMVVNSGEFAMLNFETNSTPGTWVIYSFAENLADKKEFDVASMPKVEFEFLDSVLVVKNVGNDVYNQTIKINIGENNFRELELNLKPGEERRFNLQAPDGDYNVRVQGGDAVAEKAITLTGKAVNIKDLTGMGLLSKYPIIFISILILIILVIVFLIVKYRRKNYHYRPEEPLTQNKTVKLSEQKPIFAPVSPAKDDEGMIDMRQSKVKGAEGSLVLSGTKTTASVISIKIYEGLGGNARTRLNEIIEYAKQNKGMVDWKEDHILIIFSPLVTKTYSNESIAATTAYNIFKMFNEYNKMSADKIEFNIGVNSGELISSIEDAKLKYTSIGNTIVLAKKLSDYERGKLLVSEMFKSKISRDLKTVKVGDLGGKTTIYSVNEVISRESDRKKLDDLLKRMSH